MQEEEPTNQGRISTHNVGAVRAFLIPDFRALSASAVVGGTTFLGEMVVLGWLVLELTDSSFMVGVAIGLRQMPSLIFGIPFGAVADRFDRKFLLVATVIALIVTTLITTVLLQLDWLDLWALLFLNVLLGTWWTGVRTLRQSMTYDIVGARDMVSGLSINILAQRLGGIAGAVGVGAVLDATDAATAYGVITIAHVATLLLVLIIKSRERLVTTTRESVLNNLKEFAVEVRSNPSLALLVLLTGGIEILGFSTLALMPSIARDVLGLGADGLGLIQGVASVGGMTAVLVLAVAGEIRRRGLVFLVTLVVFGASLVWLGQSSSLLMVVVAIVVVNSSMAITDVLSQGLMQSVVPNEQRGRAAGAWQVAVGFGPFGNLQIGYVAGVAGIAVALTMNGGLLFTLAGLSLVFAKGLRRL
ncbi:MAG: MFS transporter [Chloroflexota bacterium]|nr:MFS transporter [Chloroflexota bacterium]